MTFFLNLFGRNGKSANDSSGVPMAEIPQNSFIDEVAHVRTPALDAGSHVKVLNDRPYETMGYRDGYDYHDPSQMAVVIKTITAEYRDALQKELREVDAETAAVAPYLNDEVRRLMAVEYLRLSDRYDRLTTRRAELQGQYELADQGEGVCETALAKYRLGFRNGMSTYLDEQIFLNR